MVESEAYWSTWRNKANTPLEVKYDANRDGYIDWVEAKLLLRNRLTIIDTDGQVIVSTDIERAFDTDNNGILDTNEAIAIRKAIN